MSVKKYQLIITDALTNEVTILFTTLDHNLALASLNNYVQANFEIDNKWVKAVFDNERTVSIYTYNWIWPKKLVYKIAVC